MRSCVHLLPAGPISTSIVRDLSHSLTIHVPPNSSLPPAANSDQGSDSGEEEEEEDSDRSSEKEEQEDSTDYCKGSPSLGTRPSHGDEEGLGTRLHSSCPQVGMLT